MPSMPAKARILALLLSLAGGVPQARAETIHILVQNSPLAGSQYHALAEVRTEIRLHDRLTLVREPNNRHDRNAVRVDWRDHPLGYIPRSENRAVAQALDAGERLEARITLLRDDPNPWRRLEFAVYLSL